jgi:hypothetical protein
LTLSEIQIGQSGEFLTAAVLVELGVQTMVSPTAGADLLGFDDHRYWRVEVKTTNKEERPGAFRWGTARGSASKVAVRAIDCDIVALVALPLRRVVFRNVCAIRSKTTRLTIHHFHDDCERQTWSEAISWT